MRLVAPFGFYGWGNIGDESTLQGFARLVGLREQPMQVAVASRNPGHTRRVEPAFHYFDATSNRLRDRAMRRWVHARASATVFPGGTPIMDGLGDWPFSEVVPLVAAACERRQQVVFVGTGTERLSRPESCQALKRSIAPRVNHWTVRSERDRDRLMACGVDADKVTVAADLAWLLTAAPADFGRGAIADLGWPAPGFVIAVNVNNEPVVLERQPRFFEHVAGALDRAIEAYDARVLFFCNEVREGPSFDKAAAQRVLASMKCSSRAALLPNRYWTPQEMLSVLACCRIVVSTRYHACLFAALQSVPFVAIQRSDKVRDLCSDLSWPFGLELDSIGAEPLMEQIADIERQHEALTGRLAAAARNQARRSLVNHRALDALSATGRKGPTP